ncbi:PucR family transcriptional regulator [Mycolicibacterium sp.]|uniref:PucR family transcriptional regulator n=1 Tax=Mycolicibacterium sp. TaxID=2320850 RepID=UPI0037C993D1
MNTPDMAAAHSSETLTLRELLDDEVLSGAELIAGSSGLDRAISAVNVMTVPDIGRWVRQDEFLLATGYPLPRDDEDQAKLLVDLHQLGLAGIGIKLDRYMPELGQPVIDAAERLGLPLVVIPERIRFDDILSRAFAIIVNRQASALAKAQEIHHSFLAITLSGGGLSELAGSLSGLLGDASVAITDPQGTVLAQAGDEAPLVDLHFMKAESADLLRLGLTGLHTDKRTGKRWASREIRAGRLHHGFVVAVEAERPFGEFSLVAVGQAAIVAALEVTRDLAVGAVERRFSSNALFELISGSESESGEYASLGSGFGWDLERDIAVLVGRREGTPDEAHSTRRRSRLADDRAIEFWASAVRSQDRLAAAAGLGSELVAVIGADQDVLAVAHAVQDEVAHFTNGQYAIGVSRSYPGPAGVSIAYQEARTALRLGSRVSGLGAVTAYGELGLFRLLAQVSDEDLRAFADEKLGPVLRMSEPERSEMFQTLETLIEHNMNMAEAARHLHYHYNTLRYRLAKLERLLGPFSTSTPVAIQIGVALQINEMQKILATRPT